MMAERMTPEKLKELTVSNLWSFDDRDAILNELHRSRTAEHKQQIQISDLESIIKKLQGKK